MAALAFAGPLTAAQAGDVAACTAALPAVKQAGTVTRGTFSAAADAASQALGSTQSAMDGLSRMTAGLCATVGRFTY